MARTDSRGRNRALIAVLAIAGVLLLIAGLLFFLNYPANAAPKPSPSPSLGPEEQRLLELNTVASYAIAVDDP